MFLIQANGSSAIKVAGIHCMNSQLNNIHILQCLYFCVFPGAKFWALSSDSLFYFIIELELLRWSSTCQFGCPDEPQFQNRY